ncbi:HK97 gp10 family phage protein [Bacillus sp. EB106-08-02-XG196]|uniref:HK97 gp10 family phage protein n=1 Tax=Bacillus sp. EB106-08-02-XG196 TaxID=2737049 RepID=UPI0015C4A40D|nr:HK97 gp10 family phage protein [Bacillus sp. EB106-08-02-XG196]NWQ40391.1 HK97 gp10 family phage protein [Bacillus sp. EB106-08-02-XG196]
MRRLSDEAARDLVADIDIITERTVRTMANEAATNAPVKTGKLAASIPPSVEKLDDMAWQFGSDVEYATRQEYEHASKKGFFRKAVWDNREKFRQAVQRRINEL